MSTFSIATRTVLAAAITSILLLCSNATAQSKVDKLKSADEIAKAWKADGWELGDSWKPVVDAEAVQKWGESFGKAAKENDTKALMKLLDFKLNIAKAGSGLARKSDKDVFGGGFKQGVAQMLKVCCDPEGSYLFRRVELTEFGPNALMRVIGADGACNYHFWRILENEQGDLVGADAYFVLSGETLCESMQRVVVLALPPDKRNFIEKMMGAQRRDAKALSELNTLWTASNGGQHQKVLSSFDKLPQDYQNDKLVLLSGIRSAGAVNDDDKYVELLGRFRKFFPNDVAADLAGVDFHFMKEEFSKMQDAIDRVESCVGQDAHMKLLKAVGYVGSKQPQKAIEVLQQAIKIEPGYETSYWQLVEAALNEKEHAIVTDTLKGLVKEFGYAEFAMEEVDIYKDYLASPEYAKFQAFLKEYVDQRQL